LEIDNIKDKLLDQCLKFDNEIILLIISSIFAYYLDNNFNDRLSKILWDLRIWSIDNFISMINKLKEKYKWKNYYWFISKSTYWLLYSLQLEKKKTLLKEKDINNFDDSINEDINYVLSELEDLLWKNNDYNFYFQYFNTLLSYTNYNLIFMQKDSDLLKKYINIISLHLETIWNDISSYNLSAKIVFLNNITLLNKLWLKIENNYNLWNIDIQELNWLSLFSKNYSGLNIENLIKDKWQNILKYQFNNNSFSTFFNKNIDDIRKIILSITFLKHSPIRLVKEISLMYFEYIKQEKTSLVLDNYGEIEKQKNILDDEEYYNFYNTIKNSVWFDNKFIDKKIKLFLIQYLWLNVNEKNLEYKILIDFSLSKRLNNLNNFAYSKSYNESDRWNKYIWLKIYIAWEEFNYDKSILDTHKVIDFFDLIITKLYKLNNFLNSIDYRVNKINKKHIETFNHMNKIWLLLWEFKNNLWDKYKKDLKLLADSLSLSIDDFNEILWYLHDIGKSDTIDLIDIYKTINTRTDFFNTLFLILIKLIEDIDFINKINDENNENNENNENDWDFLSVNELYTLIKKQKKYDDICNSVYISIKNINFKNHISWYIMSILLYKAKELSSLLWNELDNLWLNIKILKNEFEENLVNLFDTKYAIQTRDINMNYFILSIILILKWVSGLQIKEITYPHITYSLQFFQLHPEFSYLSSVIYHHGNYPMKEEIIKYWWDIWLKNINKLLWYKNDYLWSLEDNESIKWKNKNDIMIITTMCDIVDALLSWRQYQNNDDNIGDNELLNIFTEDFKQEIIYSLTYENNINLSEIFNKIIMILDNELWQNEFYQKIRLILISKKRKILSFYK